MLTKNFQYREFEVSETAKELRIINVINRARIRDSIRALVTNVLQPLRDVWGEPMVVNSGYRCPELNKAVGGEEDSQHLLGEAADIRCDRPAELAGLAVDLGLPFDQMILYNEFVHFSHSLDGPQRGEVLYDRNYRGKRL